MPSYALTINHKTTSENSSFENIELLYNESENEFVFTAKLNEPDNTAESKPSAIVNVSFYMECSEDFFNHLKSITKFVTKDDAALLEKRQLYKNATCIYRAGEKSPFKEVKLTNYYFESYTEPLDKDARTKDIEFYKQGQAYALTSQHSPAMFQGKPKIFKQKTDLVEKKEERNSCCPF